MVNMKLEEELVTEADHLKKVTALSRSKKDSDQVLDLYQYLHVRAILLITYAIVYLASVIERKQRPG